MKSVDLERRARRSLAGALSACVIIGFVACSGATEHKAAQRESAGGDDSGGAAAAGAAPVHAGGSLSTAGQSANAGGAAGDVSALGGNAGEAPGGAGDASGGTAAGGAGSSDAGAASEAGASGSSASLGGASDGGASGTDNAGGAGGAAAFVDPVCGVNMIEVGEYALWCGKVNEHLEAGAWVPDADCSSGCNITGVGYCQKFYPSATAVVTVPQVGLKDWKNAGFAEGSSGPCNDSLGDNAGISGQAACCAPVD